MRLKSDDAVLLLALRSRASSAVVWGGDRGFCVHVTPLLLIGRI